MEEKKEETFQELFDELECIISKMEGGDLELEDSIKQYSKGVEIISKLQEKLDESEVVINELSGKIEREQEFNDGELSHA